MDAVKALQCVAIDSLGKACLVRIKEASKWCPRHDEVVGEMFLVNGHILILMTMNLGA